MASFFLACHIIGATLGQLLALLACVVAVLYLQQRKILKNKNFQQLSPRLPALDLLEKLLLRSLWGGLYFSPWPWAGAEGIFWAKNKPLPLR